MRLLGTSWSRLAAIAVAMFVSASAAKADLKLTFTGGPAGGVTGTTGGSLSGNVITFASANPTVAPVSGSISWANYTFAYTVSSSQSGTQSFVRLTGTLTGAAGATGFTSFNFNLAGNLFTTPSGSNMLLTSQLNNVSITGGNGQTTQVTTRGQVGATETIPLTADFSTYVAQGFNNATGQSNTSTIPSLSPGYTINSLNSSVTGVSAGSTIIFTATAFVSAPEPAGIAAAMMGLPCVAGVVTFARRRLRSVVA
jgi:hypothetical protein